MKLKKLSFILITSSIILTSTLSLPMTSLAKENIPSSQVSTKETGYITYRDTIVSTKRKNNIWVGYHSGTPHWSKASSYTISAGKSFSVSGSYTFEGISCNIGFSYSKTVTTTIPANFSKYSRLGIRGDFTFKKIKRQYYEDNVAIGKPSYRVVSTRHNYYIAPVYK